MAIAETIIGAVPGGTRFGKFFHHPMMSDGSLLLFDPTHSAGSFVGNPVYGDQLPNVAAETAAQLLGVSETEETISAYVAEPTGFDGYWEHGRSEKGGMAAAYSHTGLVGNTGSLAFGITAGQGGQAPGVKDYIYANLDHDFFFSIWLNVLRGSDYAPAQQATMNMASNTTNYVVHNAGGGMYNGATSDALKRDASTVLAGGSGPKLMNTQISGMTGSTAASLLASAGAFGPWSNGNREYPVSGILERVYIEDLTVSGRTYAEVDALDLALHTAAHAEGGAWYGDSFTDPTTLDD